MGATCCKDTTSTTASQMTISGKEGGPNEEASPQTKVKRKVAIRRTVQSEDIGLTAEDVEARHGAEDPDLEKICREAAERKAAREAKAQERQKLGHRPSFSENQPEEIDRTEGSDGPMVAKRCKGRKGTGFVKKNDAPPAEEDGEEEEDDAKDVATPKRAKDRKGTGFVKKGALPIDDDDEEEEEEAETTSAPKRCKNRKGTGFVKKGALPIDDDDEDED
mmetsp:Transcript_139616/g.260300  ORF Transcript_139616/g.260300 Transcript_139616/m.260300 type:complete len:220 (+) Transcript_139616:69-728(+)